MDKSGVIEEKQRYNAPFLRAFDMLAAQIAGGKQKNLAEMMGTYSSHISDYRNGKKRVSPEMMDSLIRVSEQIPDGAINRYYLTGDSQYMLFRNVPDAEFLALQSRETDPDYDLIQQNKMEVDLGSSSTLASVPDVQKQKEQVDITTDLLTQSAKLIAQNEAIRRQLIEELTLLQQLRQDYTDAIQHLNQATAKLTSNYFPSLAAEPKNN
jgi:hypothetical protein